MVHLTFIYCHCTLLVPAALISQQVMERRRTHTGWRRKGRLGGTTAPGFGFGRRVKCSSRMGEFMKHEGGETRRGRILEQQEVKKGCCNKLGVHFAWLHSAGDCNYFSASLALRVRSCMLQSTASDYQAAARCQAVITFTLESISEGQKAHGAGMYC